MATKQKNKKRPSGSRIAAALRKYLAAQKNPGRVRSIKRGKLGQWRTGRFRVVKGPNRKLPLVVEYKPIARARPRPKTKKKKSSRR